MSIVFQPKTGTRLLARLAAAVMAGLAVCAAFAAEAAARRVALVVGVADYQAVAPLRNTLNDSIRMAAALERLGFEVTRVENPKRAAFAEALRDFGAKAAEADSSLFFYAGHALEVSGHNWLLPVDARIESARDLSLAAVDVESVLDHAKLASTAIIFLDACRNNPFAERLAAGSRGVATRGLARIDPPSRVLVAFATAPGQVALDGNGANSPFTEALLHHIETPGLEIRQLMSRVRADVHQATRDQVPWEQSALEGDFFFVDPVKLPPMPVAAPAAGTTLDNEALFWDSVRGSANAADYEAYLAHYPVGLYAVLARSRVVALRAALPVPQPVAPQTVAPVEPVAPAPPPVIAVLAPPPAPTPDPVPPALAVLPPALEPTVVVPAPIALAPVPPPVPDRDAIVRQLEERLRTLGCYRGEIDADWAGVAATTAMARVLRANTGKHLPGDASETLLTQLANADIKACTPECSRGFSLQGGACVRKACADGQVRTARGTCVEAPQVQAPVRHRQPRHVARPPPEPDPVRVRQPRRVVIESPAPVRHMRPHVVRERAAPSGGGGGGGARCFTVDGRQFCS